MSLALGVSPIGVMPLAGVLSRADPVVTVTAPSGTVEDSTLEISFTYQSDVGRAQASYQFQVRTEDGGTTLYDSTTVVSTATSGISIPFVFSGGSGYRIYVRASDGFDTSDWDYSTISYESTSVFPTSSLVGSVYEIAINGTGYMLSDTPEQPVERRTTTLDAPRFATGETPFSEAVERYTFVGMSDFKGGAGQSFRGRTDSSPDRYFDSENINPFDEDCLQLIFAPVESMADTDSVVESVVAGGDIYMSSGVDGSSDAEIKHQSAIEGTVTTFTVAAAGTPVSMASDGTNWYLADGAAIFRGDDETDPGAAWATENAILVRWCSDRLAAVYDDGGGNLALTTYSPSGAEESAGGRFLFPDTVTIPDIASGDGYMWWIVNRDGVSQVHYWELGSSETYAAIGFTLPAGQRALSLGFYLGNVFIRAVEDLPDSEWREIIYRAVPNAGTLTPTRVVAFEPGVTTGQSSAGFAGDDRFVAFPWRAMSEDDGYSGIGVIDLSTGGYARFQFSDSTAAVRSVNNWNGRWAFTIDGSGLWVESDTVETTGWLETSYFDQASGLVKLVDEVSASFDPLPNGGTIGMERTTDQGGSYASLGDDATSSGQKSETWDSGERVRSYGLRVTLGTSTDSPKLRFMQVKLNPESVADQLAVFPINCSDELSGLNGQPLLESGTGVSRLKTLQSLISSQVVLQDVDWPITASTTTWQLVDVRGQMYGFFDRAKNRRVDTGIALVTLRRSA